MKITLKEFKEKSFLIPLSLSGGWADYKEFESAAWRQNIVNVFRIVLSGSNPSASKEDVSKNAEQQVDMFVQNIRENLTPQTPCLALAFAPAQCWFVAFFTEAFLPLEGVTKANVFETVYYSDMEQTMAIIHCNADPMVFALNLVNELEELSELEKEIK